MSISAYYVRVEREDYDRFLVCPQTVDRFFGYVDPAHQEHAKALCQEGRTLSLGTWWQAIYYLLTDEVAEPEECRPSEPMGKAVFGGPTVSSVEYDDYSGSAWYLCPEDVVKIARELDSRPPAVLRESYEGREHEGVDIYHMPPPSEWSGMDLDIVLTFYSHLRDFYRDASGEGDAVFVWIG